MLEGVHEEQLATADAGSHGKDDRSAESEVAEKLKTRRHRQDVMPIMFLEDPEELKSI